MITDARALRKSYVPQELHHCEGQIDYLSSALRPITHGFTGEDAFIFGPSGTGKTTIAKYVLRQLERERLEVRWGYVNCITDSTKAGVFYQLVRDAGRGADLRREGTPTATFLDRLRNLDGHFVAVIDEVHALDDSDTLLALYDLDNVSLVMISLDENKLFAEFNGQLKSRFQSAPKVELEKYRHHEMVDILDGRASAALAPGVTDGETIEFIADLAAGDAREGIAYLRRAAKYVLEHQCDAITPDVVEEIAEDAQREIHSSLINSLGTHKRLLYDIINDAGEVSSSDLHARYEHEIDDPKSKSMRRRYLNSLEGYEIIASSGSGRGTRYSHIGY